MFQKSTLLWFITVAAVLIAASFVTPLRAWLSNSTASTLVDGASLGDQFRLSHAGADGDPNFKAFDAAVAYNSEADEYLIVWAANVDEGEVEIYGQRLDPTTQTMLGAPVRISTMGPDGDPNYTAQHPAVAYNSTNAEYLVVWQGDDNSGPLVDDEFEIFGQRLAGSSGALIGDRIRISQMGADGSTQYTALNPAVVYNHTENQYLAVWQGDETDSLSDNKIYGQRLDATSGNQFGDTVLVSAPPDGDANFRAQTPSVAYNDSGNEYLVVWSGDDNNPPLVAGEMEIFGQRLDATDGARAGNRIRISAMGADGEAAYDAVYPSVVYNPTNNEYLTVWTGDDNNGELVENEFEVFGQRLDALTGALAANRIRISQMGPDGDPTFQAIHPAISYHGALNQYLVAWRGDDNRESLVEGELEIFSQWLDAATGTALPGGSARVSHMGSSDGSTAFQADRPAVASYVSGENVIVVWHGDDDRDSLVEDEYELFARQFEVALPPTPTPTPPSLYLPSVMK